MDIPNVDLPPTRAPPSSATATFGQFTSEEFVVGGGVAIFHIASARVVVCSTQGRSGETYYFLPKGRRDAGEEGGRGAEREGWEESGYRNRLLPLPTPHLQPQAHPRTTAKPLTAEPVWMQFMPMRRGRVQYILFWYIAETLPPDIEHQLNTSPFPNFSFDPNSSSTGTSPTDQAATGVEHLPPQPYNSPPPFPPTITLKQRIAQEPAGYEPLHHEGTGVDEDERAYKSYLLPIDEAVKKLGGKTGGVMADVVVRGWKGIQARFALEEDAEAGVGVRGAV